MSYSKPVLYITAVSAFALFATALVPALQEKGCTVLQPDAPPEAASCIISFFKPGTELAPLQQKLLDAGIFTSLRGDRAGQKYIRLSPHFYNTDAELQRVIEML